MTVRREMPYKEGIYFTTFTCYEWMPLIGLVDAYDAVYHQFDILKLEGHYVLGFVIMPNRVHAILGIRNKGESINKRIGTFFSPQRLPKGTLRHQIFNAVLVTFVYDRSTRNSCITAESLAGDPAGE